MRVGIISDTHFPAVHPAALQFVLDVFHEWRIRQVVHIGDVCELHNPSFHENHPDMPGPKDEFDQSNECVHVWDDTLRRHRFVSRARPMLVCKGNHDGRPERVAAKFGVTKEFLKAHNEVWGVNWIWDLEHEIDGVLYMHGHKRCGGGEHPAHLTIKKGLDQPLVLGHYHTKGGINPLPGRKALRWGMDVGCLIDRLHPAMEYAEGGAAKQMMSVGVVIDGHPYYEMMPCGPGEEYHRSLFV